MSRLIMARHGQSLWNKANIFTGWVDISLSWEGIQEAIELGKMLAQEPIDLIYSSSLVRCQMTAMIVMSLHSSGKVPVLQHPGEGKMDEWGKIYDPKTAAGTIPVVQAWQLNERMYGELQGLNKDEARARFGESQVQVWRRSYDVAPPHGENLKMTAERSIPYFKNEILPKLIGGKNIFISAHGNSLRSIIMHLDGLTEEQVVKLELETGKPIVYECHNGQLNKVIAGK